MPCRWAAWPRSWMPRCPAPPASSTAWRSAASWSGCASRTTAGSSSSAHAAGLDLVDEAELVKSDVITAALARMSVEQLERLSIATTASDRHRDRARGVARALRRPRAVLATPGHAPASTRRPAAPAPDERNPLGTHAHGARRGPHPRPRRPRPPPPREDGDPVRHPARPVPRRARPDDRRGRAAHHRHGPRRPVAADLDDHDLPARRPRSRCRSTASCPTCTAASRC